MAYSTSPRNSQGYSSGNKPSPRKNVLEDGPIKELVCVIEDTRAEQWQKRTSALANVVAQIPTGNDYSRRESWFNSPPTLRHLHQPVGELLKDPRSTVVKRTCESLGQIFAKCQGDAKYLFKDLMPVVLNVHAQTVQVIRQQVQTMVLDAIPVVPCKMAMPLWLERLKTDKSRTVREACVLYLGMGLKHWSGLENGELGTSYLTEENWVQIGTAFIHTLRDPSPVVRQYAKSGIATIRDYQPDLWDRLIRDPDGPAAKDTKLQKWLIKVSESGGDELNGGNEELSVASRYSHYSVASKKGGGGGGGGAPATPNSRAGGGGGGGFGNPNRPRTSAVPVQISVGGSGSGNNNNNIVGDNAKEKQPAGRSMRALGPPLRRPFAQAMDPNNNNNGSSPTHRFSSGSGGGAGGGGNFGYTVPQLGTPPRPPPPAASSLRGRPQLSPTSPQKRSPSPSPRRSEPRHHVPLRSRSASSGGSNPSSSSTLLVEQPPPPQQHSGGGGGVGSGGVGGGRTSSINSNNMEESDDNRSVFSSARSRLRPTPEALMNGGGGTSKTMSGSGGGGSGSGHQNNKNHHPGGIKIAPVENPHTRGVIDLVDQASPQNFHPQQLNFPEDSEENHHNNEYSSGIYSNATSTDMLDVTKSIDQTLAHPFLQQQQQQHQLHQPLSSPPHHPQQQQQLSMSPPLSEQPYEQLSYDVVEEGPFIASMNELKQHASKRRSRRSIKLQERWSRHGADSVASVLGGAPSPLATVPTTPADAVSSLGGGSIVDNNNNNDSVVAKLPPVVVGGAGGVGSGLAPTGPSALPEHYVIAEQLLRVHKTHVDQIMETLKIEMDTLRDFEQSLEQEQAPTPDQVLDYFESVGLCLDQRTTAGNILQREMDRISKGAFHGSSSSNAGIGDGGGVEGR